MSVSISQTPYQHNLHHLLNFHHFHLLLLSLSFFLIAPIHSLDTLFRTDIIGDVIWMSQNGQAIGVWDSGSVGGDQLTIFKTDGNGVYKRIGVKNVSIWVPNVQGMGTDKRYMRPVFNSDGSQLYYIDKNSGMLTKSSLLHTTESNPYVDSISFNTYSCTTPYSCLFALNGNYKVFYNPSTHNLTIISFDEILYTGVIVDVRYYWDTGKVMYYYLYKPEGMEGGYGFYCYCWAAQQCYFYYYATEEIAIQPENLTFYSISLSSDGRTVKFLTTSNTTLFYTLHSSTTNLTNSLSYSFILGSYSGSNALACSAQKYTYNLFPYEYRKKGMQMDRDFWWLEARNPDGGVMSRLVGGLGLVEVSGDGGSLQGYTVTGSGNEYGVQLIQIEGTVNNYYSVIDLQIYEQQPISMYTLNHNGTLVAYLSGRSITMLRHTLSTMEIVYPCYNLTYRFKNSDKCMNTNIIIPIIIGFSGLLLIIVIILIGCYCTKCNKCRSNRVYHDGGQGEDAGRGDVRVRVQRGEGGENNHALGDLNNNGIEERGNNGHRLQNNSSRAQNYIQEQNGGQDIYA